MTLGAVGAIFFASSDWHLAPKRAGPYLAIYSSAGRYRATIGQLPSTGANFPSVNPHLAKAGDNSA
jgi:hypothetical protein